MKIWINFKNLFNNLLVYIKKYCIFFIKFWGGGVCLWIVLDKELERVFIFKNFYLVLFIRNKYNLFQFKNLIYSFFYYFIKKIWGFFFIHNLLNVITIYILMFYLLLLFLISNIIICLYFYKKFYCVVSLSKTVFQKKQIQIDWLKYFQPCPRGLNKEFNDCREFIIYTVLRNEIPKEFLVRNDWCTFVAELKKMFPIDVQQNILKIGNRDSSDFRLLNINIDFKFNCRSVFSYPQIKDIPTTSLGNICYGSFFFKFSGITEIKLKDYLDFLWDFKANEKSLFFFNLKSKYQSDMVFKKNYKIMTHSSIKAYIRNVDICLIKLACVINNINKRFLLYYQGKWMFEDILWKHNLIICFEIKRTDNAIWFSTNLNIILKLRLCWKNNTGVLNPIWKLSISKKK